MKELTLPSVQHATKNAIETCYGSFIVDDPRWTAGLTQFNAPPLQKRSNKPIELIYTRACPRLQEVHNE